MTEPDTGDIRAAGEGHDDPDPVEVTDPNDPSYVEPALPDPGNSPPEDWTEEIDPAEVQEIAERLQRESGR